MSTRGGELVAADESAVMSEPFLDATVVEDSKSDKCLPDPPWTDESDRGQVFCKADDLLHQFVTSETGPRPWGWDLSRCAGFRYKILDPLGI